MKNLICFLFVLFSVGAWAQTSFCGQAEVLANLFNQHPEWRKEFEENLKKASISHSKLVVAKSGEPDFMVPVVFHILHQFGSENISDAQVQDQIRILNRDFQKHNADTSIIVPAFASNIANVKFGFKLAGIDPQGNCTNGIVRHVTPKTNWDANNLADFTFSWPRNKYLNIYVVRSLNISATAYAFLPGTPIQPGADVIVTIHNMVGSIGTGTVANSRVLTHEVAHWFGVQHIWGTSNQPGVVCGDDLVDDTPITKGFITCATTNSEVCTPGVPENTQNYMDYSPCKIMFTNGQADRMRSFLTGTLNGRNNLYSAANLQNTGLSGSAFVCLPVADFKTSSFKKCTDIPIQFTSLTQTGLDSFSRQWTFQGGNPATSTDSIVFVTYQNPGLYRVTLQVGNAHGNSILTREDYITIVDGNSGAAPPYSLDFESESPIANLNIWNNDLGSISWGKNENVGSTGTNTCFMLNSFNDDLQIAGEKDAFELPYLDLTGVNDLSLTFNYSYARLTSAQRDSFKVQYSLDCGGNWTSIGGIPTTAFMSSFTGGITSDPFIPNQAQWREHMITSNRLTGIVNKTGVKIRFLFVKDIAKTAANNLFVDQIQLAGTVTNNSSLLQKASVSIFPNPSEGSFLVKMTDLDGFEYSLIDSFGRKIDGHIEKPIQNELIINADKKLKKGLYTLMINNHGRLFPHKLVVN